MQVHELRPAQGSRKSKRIVGRGPGSGRGKTSGRGQTGQNSRSGRGIAKNLEGGQMPLIRRLPKVGFRSHRPLVYQLLSLKKLSQLEAGTVVSAALLKEKGLIKNPFKPYKVLGTGDIQKALSVEAYSFSRSAEEKITKAGGSITIIDQQVLKNVQDQERSDKK